MSTCGYPKYFMLLGRPNAKVSTRGTLKFGMCTVDLNPSRFIFLGMELGDEHTTLYVCEGDSVFKRTENTEKLAFSKINSEIANEIHKLLRYVLEGRIDYDTYCKEMAELEAKITK